MICMSKATSERKARERKKRGVAANGLHRQQLFACCLAIWLPSCCIILLLRRRRRRLLPLSIIGTTRARISIDRHPLFRRNTKKRMSSVQKACFGMGCFWGGEAAFGVVRGVIRTKVGYSGGTTSNPTYRNIGDHTESVELQYDPNEISYQSLLEIFWDNHEPLYKHKRQYMSAIFYHGEDQRRQAEKLIQEKSVQHPHSITTVINPAGIFYDAEDYHQKYALRRHSQLLKQLKFSDKDVIDQPLAACLNGYLNGYGSLAEFDKVVGKLNLSDDIIKYLRSAIPNAVRHC